MMQQTYPLVSVLMTAYNREKYIAEAIESVLASDYENFELIIVDDCSNDETVTIAKKYALKDSRVQVHINEVNLGDYPNRNRAAGYAKGIYLMYCDSDDTLYPDGVSRCVQLMQEHPGISFAMYHPNDKGTPLVLSSADALHQHFLTKPFLTVGPGGTIISRSFFEKIKGFPEKYGPANDMYYNLKCTSLSPILLIPFEFLNYRIHAGQEINNRDSYLHNSYLFLKDALKELDLFLTPKELDWVSKKNKRRFFVNLLRFAFKKRDVPRLKQLIKTTGFGIKDAFEAIFN